MKAASTLNVPVSCAYAYNRSSVEGSVNDVANAVCGGCDPTLPARELEDATPGGRPRPRVDGRPPWGV